MPPHLVRVKLTRATQDNRFRGPTATGKLMTQNNRRGFIRRCLGAGFGCSVARGHTALAEALEEPKRLQVVTLEGSPLECGLTHGKTLKAAIHALLKVWKADLAERYRMDADAFIKKFLERTNYLPALKNWTPKLIEEIGGIAKGADVDFDTMLVFQLIDEYWVHGSSIAHEHCSSLGISRRGDQPSVVAQNMDLEGFRDGFQTVLHIKQAGSVLEQLVLTHAGLIGLNGMNNRSLGICCNTLNQLVPCADGLPVACVVRGVLQQQTEEAALKFLRTVKHASGQNYVLGCPAKVYDLECSAGKVKSFAPNTWPEGVWHTNHPLCNDDYTPKHRELIEKRASENAPDNSAARLQSLRRHLTQDAQTGRLELIRSALAATDSAQHPVCVPYRNKKDSFTFASTIMILSDKPEFHVSPGPANVYPYQTHSFGR
jgi:isopenicillin-N N-acyltransferase like protein